MMACISKYDFSSWPFRRKVSSMRREHVLYVTLETTIGMAINAILSMGLAYAMFEAHVPMPGDGSALLRDIGMQCFIVALASVVVPTLLTRRRCHGGTIQTLERRPGWERRAGWSDNILLRGLLIAACATAIGVALLHWAILPQLAPARFTISAFVALKGTVGAVVAFAVTPIAVHLALGDAAPVGSHT
jgi:small-conductance mechanosensitive channel